MDSASSVPSHPKALVAACIGALYGNDLRKAGAKVRRRKGFSEAKGIKDIASGLPSHGPSGRCVFRLGGHQVTWRLLMSAAAFDVENDGPDGMLPEVIVMAQV
ncbi:hypothetical protein JQ614_32165 [Bradyrhizobium diazoefficiens]|uniref:hypothetical protein n=1 Tax=Bradyrhizobium diazoefficiens TaxID=1355477 RepID=UPI001B8BCA64|nr:hypothetical protein [Bradyrhizobium diazoefficiens]MBR0866286.1 hypothetical protein [Bradyrhizobium diazoefficiens]MBR0890747.1 hypothetical protein [Bradyrhizobium diazoefficiens]MBR0922580.1 hypothetical protein [Bradyrhizobium diazoefficiens]